MKNRNYSPEEQKKLKEIILERYGKEYDFSEHTLKGDGLPCEYDTSYEYKLARYNEELENKKSKLHEYWFGGGYEREQERIKLEKRMKDRRRQIRPRSGVCPEVLEMGRKKT